MSILLNEDRITRAIDQSNFDQIAIDRNGGQRSYNIFNGLGDDDSMKRDKMQKSIIQDYRRYRQYPKVDDAVTDIKNSMVPIMEDRDVVEILVDELDFMFESPKTLNNLKKELPKSFDRVKSLLRFNIDGNQYADDWYTDGCLYVYVNYNKEGLQEVRMLDPLKLTLVEENKKMYYEYNTGIKDEYGRKADKEKIPYNKVIFVASGLKDPSTGLNIGHLNKAIRPINLLQMMENSLVIHRFVRAPERWVFQIDVSNMGSQRGKSFIKKMRDDYRSRFTIDAITGELKSNSNIMAMQENFWLPKTDSNNGGHEISTVGGNMQGIGEIDDILLFQKEVYKALNVPISRLEPDATFQLGNRVEEINRDEKKFMTFIKSLRNKFNKLFIRLLKIDLVSKLISKPEEFEAIKDQIRFRYENDNTYELAAKRAQLENIFEIASQYEDFALKWYGEDWFMENMLRMTKEQMDAYHKRKAELEAQGVEDEEEEEE